MPPKSLGRTLSPEEIDLLKRWIEQGAEWKTHWAFLPPVAAPVPEVKDPTWPRNPLDRFVLARLEAEQLTPAPEAEQGAADPPRHLRPDRLAPDPRGDRRLPGRSRARRLRAAGRPPAGLAAVRRADGRRLARPGPLRRHLRLPGRRLSRHVALARLGRPGLQRATCPTTGSSPGNWPATCCPSPTRDQVLATAFNRHHRQTNEGGSIEEEFRVEYVADRTNTFATAFLGLTLECARCHSHKYDPITQKEYYQLFGFFDSIDESGLYSHFTDAVPTPTLLLTSADQDRRDRGGRGEDPGRRGRAGPTGRTAAAGVRGLARARRSAGTCPCWRA